jgi:hypothetical protein
VVLLLVFPEIRENPAEKKTKARRTMRKVILRIPWKSFIAVSCILAVTACVSYGTKVDQGKVAQFVKGKTTYEEVIQELGKPTQSMMSSDGTRTVTYTYMQSQITPATFIPFVGMFRGGSESENTQGILNFDKNSVLTNYSASEGGMSMGTGITSGKKQ